MRNNKFLGRCAHVSHSTKRCRLRKEMQPIDDPESANNYEIRISPSYVIREDNERSVRREAAMHRYSKNLFRQKRSKKVV
jgi:hypothetical protein